MSRYQITILVNASARPKNKVLIILKSVIDWRRVLPALKLVNKVLMKTSRQPVASATPVAYPCADNALLLDGDSIAVSDWVCKAGFCSNFCDVTCQMPYGRLGAITLEKRDSLSSAPDGRAQRASPLRMGMSSAALIYTSAGSAGFT